MEYCDMINQLLEKDSEALKRDLQLSTFKITPINRNTGLIQWINETSTIKGIVSEYWKKDNIKGEMKDI